MIFEAVREGRPYPEHGLRQRDWAAIPPRQISMDRLITTKRVLELDRLLDTESTFYGDLFPHVVEWDDQLYLEDGLHRALRTALQHRNSILARVYIFGSVVGGHGAPPAATSWDLPDAML